VAKTPKQIILENIEAHLERTPWGKGGAIMATRGNNRTVASWPGARPGQISAGARKIYDILTSIDRRANARRAVR
jgi:hypothetical protein